MRKKGRFIGYQTDLIESTTGKMEYFEKNESFWMKSFICYIHKIYFWRNKSTLKGICGTCRFFNEEYHVAVNSARYMYEVKGMVKVKKAIKIDDGEYNLVIKDVQERTDPYDYFDFIVEVEGADLKYGCPMNISVLDGQPSSKLAKLLVALGIKLEENAEIELDDIKKAAIGKKVQIQVKNEETEQGRFARIKNLKVLK